jgi:hypothetical protein
MKLNKRDAPQDQEADPDHRAPEGNDLRLDAADDGIGNAVEKPRPLVAARQYCLWCCNDSALEVNLCTAKRCSLWPYRFGRKPSPEILAEVADRPIYPPEDVMTGAEFHKNHGTVLKSIKRRCLDCSGYSKSKVRHCQYVASCSLHPFRFGTNLKRKMSPEQRKIAAERLKANIKKGKEERTTGKLDRN